MPKDPNVVTSPGVLFPTFEIKCVGTNTVTLKPAWFADVLQRLGEAMSAEEHARRLKDFRRTNLSTGSRPPLMPPHRKIPAH